jgi:SAM-dependent methyltransferase
MTYNFQRYLTAKKSVDDRSLNRYVLDTLRGALPVSSGVPPLHMLEIGCGIGTMLERLIEWRVITSGLYIGLDLDGLNIAETRRRLVAWAAKRGIDVEDRKTDLWLRSEKVSLQVRLHQADVLEFCARGAARNAYDLVIASAFMDLVDVFDLLPRMGRLLRPNGLLYLALNFDGETVLLPEIDPEQDHRIIETYHASMDRITATGRPAGGRYTGRKLLHLLGQSGTEILAAGSSDWILWPGAAGYTPDEAYFLHFITHTIALELRGRSQIDSVLLEDWIRRRHRQIDRGELTFIAKQLDCLARAPAREDRGGL